MKKIVAVIVLAVFAAGMVAAQQSPKKILGGKDIDAFIANYEALEADLDALEGKYDYIFEDTEEFAEGDDLGSTFTKLRAIDVPGEIRDIFKKHGLGSDGFEKMIVITSAFQSLEMDNQVALYREQFKDNPEMASYLDQAEAQNESLRTSMHASDMKLVESRMDDLRAFFAE